ncbi:hypothetical protein N7486_006555 [Penicillium sp. IBT 16267x]|nr:hypothetical protein N7486_006555 [Penicillium sp. IBT 16267x]
MEDEFEFLTPIMIVFPHIFSEIDQTRTSSMLETPRLVIGIHWQYIFILMSKHVAVSWIIVKLHLPSFFAQLNIFTEPSSR